MHGNTQKIHTAGCQECHRSFEMPIAVKKHAATVHKQIKHFYKSGSSAQLYNQSTVCSLSASKWCSDEQDCIALEFWAPTGLLF